MDSMKRDEEMGALWVKQGARGEFWTGKIGDVPVVVFRNDNKKNPKSPDFRILRARTQDKPAPAPADDFDVPF